MKGLADILHKIQIGEKNITDAHAEICSLFSAGLSLLGVAKCPNGNCDNNGTIATQEYPSGEWIPEPCEWCHRKKELLNNGG